jgi:spore coat polysaccharide biosynthesis protein SpsF
MRSIAIVQARLDSKRLPGKALKRIGDRTVLEWVIDQTQQIRLDDVVVATSHRRADEPIAQLCEQLEVPCFRGSPHDVLGRYHACALEYQATHILRVTADCPMLDPGLNTTIIRCLENNGYDYVASQGWHEGLGQEAFTFKALHRAWMLAESRFDREHVVTFMLDHPRMFRAYFIENKRPRTNLKLSVDTSNDLSRLRRIHEFSAG